jgi:hypothetical protein
VGNMIVADVRPRMLKGVGREDQEGGLNDAVASAVLFK